MLPESITLHHSNHIDKCRIKMAPPFVLRRYYSVHYGSLAVNTSDWSSVLDRTAKIYCFHIISENNRLFFDFYAIPCFHFER
jgi:hypothetical protein